MPLPARVEGRRVRRARGGVRGRGLQRPRAVQGGRLRLRKGLDREEV